MTPSDTSTPASVSAEEALEKAGLPVPDLDVTSEERIRVSDLDEWSIKVRFSGDRGVIEQWWVDAFGTLDGYTLQAGEDVPSERLTGEDATSDGWSTEGSNPEDRNCSYAVLLLNEDTEVLAALARVAR